MFHAMGPVQGDAGLESATNSTNTPWIGSRVHVSRDDLASGFAALCVRLASSTTAGTDAQDVGFEMPLSSLRRRHWEALFARVDLANADRRANSHEVFDALILAQALNLPHVTDKCLQEIAEVCPETVLQVSVGAALDVCASTESEMAVGEGEHADRVNMALAFLQPGQQQRLSRLIANSDAGRQALQSCTKEFGLEDEPMLTLPEPAAMSPRGVAAPSFGMAGSLPASVTSPHRAADVNEEHARTSGVGCQKASADPGCAANVSSVNNVSLGPCTPHSSTSADADVSCGRVLFSSSVDEYAENIKEQWPDSESTKLHCKDSPDKSSSLVFDLSECEISFECMESTPREKSRSDELAQESGATNRRRLCQTEGNRESMTHGFRSTETSSVEVWESAKELSDGARQRDVLRWVDQWLAEHPKSIDRSEAGCQRREERRQQLVRRRGVVSAPWTPDVAALVSGVGAPQHCGAASMFAQPSGRTGSARSASEEAALCRIAAAELTVKCDGGEALQCNTRDLPAAVGRELHTMRRSRLRAESCPLRAAEVTPARSGTGVHDSSSSTGMDSLLEFLRTLDDDMSSRDTDASGGSGDGHLATSPTGHSEPSIVGRATGTIDSVGDVRSQIPADCDAAVERARQRAASHKRHINQKHQSNLAAIRHERFGRRDARLQRFVRERSSAGTVQKPLCELEREGSFADTDSLNGRWSLPSSPPVRQGIAGQHGWTFDRSGIDDSWPELLQRVPPQPQPMPTPFVC